MSTLSSIGKLLIALTLSAISLQARSIELEQAYVSLAGWTAPGINGYGVNGSTNESWQGYVTNGEYHVVDHGTPTYAASSTFVSKPSPTLTSVAFNYSNIQAGYTEAATPGTDARGSFRYQFGISGAENQDFGLIPVTVSGYAATRLHIARTGDTNDFSGPSAFASWGIMTGGYNADGNGVSFSLGNAATLYQVSNQNSSTGVHTPAGFILLDYSDIKMNWINIRGSDEILGEYYGVLPFSFSFYIRQNEAYNIYGENYAQAQRGYNTLSVTHVSAYTVLDPVITIGEAYQNMGLSIITSQFMGNEAALVPEPENYAMLLAGLGLIGLSKRRKHHN
jgi:hypothetical protein